MLAQRSGSTKTSAAVTPGGTRSLRISGRHRCSYLRSRMSRFTRSLVGPSGLCEGARSAGAAGAGRAGREPPFQPGGGLADHHVPLGQRALRVQDHGCDREEGSRGETAPKPLPTPPPIPYAYLLALGRQIDSTELDQEQQTMVVDQLHRAILEETDEGVHQDIVDMLRNLTNKPWATRRTEFRPKESFAPPRHRTNSPSVDGRRQPRPPSDQKTARSHQRISPIRRPRHQGEGLLPSIHGRLGRRIHSWQPGFSRGDCGHGLARALFGFLAFGGPVFLVGWLVTLFSTHLARRRHRR